MAVKAQASIPVSKEVDIDAYYRYYLSVLSTLSAPTISDTNVIPPTSTINGTSYTWQPTQPSFDTSGTYTLYFVDCTVFSNGTLKYSDVSVAADFEAATTAYNTAVGAQTTANNAAKVATNYMSYTTADGLMIADMTNGVESPSTATSRNVLIDSDSVDIRDGTTTLATFGETVRLGEKEGRRLTLSSLGMSVFNSIKERIFELTESDSSVTRRVVEDPDWNYNVFLAPGHLSGTLTHTFSNTISNGKFVIDYLVGSSRTNAKQFHHEFTYSGSNISWDDVLTDGNVDLAGFSWTLTSTSISVTAVHASAGNYTVGFKNFSFTYTTSAPYSYLRLGRKNSGFEAFINGSKINTDFLTVSDASWSQMGDYLLCHGHITSSNKNIRLSYILPGTLDEDITVNMLQITDFSATIRHCGGGYIGTTTAADSNGEDLTQYASVSSIQARNIITISLTNSNGWKSGTTITNNTPVDVAVRSLTITVLPQPTAVNT